MRDYGQIVTKLASTPWLITPEGMDILLDIADRRLNGLAITDEMKDQVARGREERKYRTYGAGVSNGVGILPIEGPIFGKANLMTSMSGATSLSETRRDFRAMLVDDDVTSMVLEMDTPGGSIEFLREFGDEIFAAREKKPIYAIANSECCSAGLWLASQATQFFANPSAGVGSLGVFRVHVDQSKRDNDQGNKYTFIKAGQFKTEGNPHEPLTEAAKDFHQSQVNETYNDFLAVVARGRNKEVSFIEENFGQGRTFNAKQALAVGMVDGVIEMDQLVSTLANKTHPVQVELPDGSYANAVITINNSKLEVTGWEHSEPGAGTPPIERTDEDDKSGDRKGSGSRRDTPPIVAELEEENAKTSSMHEEGGSDMPALSAEALKALGLSTDASDEAISAAVTTLAASANTEQLKQQQQKSFEEMFPDQAAKLARADKNNATAFANDHKVIMTGIGDAAKASTSMLSTIAMDKVADTYTAITNGTKDEALEAFANCLSVLNSEAGRVDLAEHGSSRATGEPTPTDDDDTDDDEEIEDGATTNGEAAKKLNKRAMQLQRAAGGETKLSYGDALAKASKQLPQAAKVYNGSLNSR